MIVLINNSVSFDSLNRVLTHIQTGEHLSLTPTAANLLTLIIKENKILSREKLLDDVWEKNGINGSYNNLNQFLSLLRKSLNTLGLNEVIETVPKEGIRLYSNVIIEYLSNAPQEQRDNDIRLHADENTSAQYNPPNKIIIKVLLLISFVFFILAISLYLLPNQKYMPLDQIKTNDGINVFTTKLFEHDNSYHSTVEEIRRKIPIKMRSDNFNFIWYENMLSRQHLGRALISICSSDDENTAEFCENIYYTTLDNINENK